MRPPVITFLVVISSIFLLCGTKLMASSHMLFIKTDGSLWSMGENQYGQLGDGTTTDRTSPTQILASGVKQVAVGKNHSYFIKTDGSLWAMGDNQFGQFGNGSTAAFSKIPVKVQASGTVNFVTAGDDFGLFISKTGQLMAMGRNHACLLYTSPSPRDATLSRMPSSA